MNTYEVMFETDEGLLMCEVEGRNLRDATNKLKAAYPDDVGADGTITDEDGNEYPINW